MQKVKILVFSGSLRKESFNQKLAAVAAEGARQAGAEVTLVSLRDYPMPIFDEDLEAQGTPENAKKFKELMKAHHGFIISSPEYNSSITAALKNSLDWASRKTAGEPGLAAFAGKTAALISASPGALGGLRGLVHLRSMLGNIQTLVIPDQFALSQADKAFEENGSLKDPKQTEKVMGISKKLVELTGKLIAEK